jgi:hypothetical protein
MKEKMVCIREVWNVWVQKGYMGERNFMLAYYNKTSFIVWLKPLESGVGKEFPRSHCVL